jgi:hypothetical protein
MTCTGSGGNVTEIATVTVSGAASVSLVATPIVVQKWGYSILTWTTANVSSCTASGSWWGTKNPSGGTQTVFFIASDKTYTISCLDLGGGTITANATVRISACSDGIDNDGDGLVDMADPGCSNASDNDETHITACSDGGDNDGDGFVDMDDPDCDSSIDTSESGSFGLGTQCSDGLDNDGDNLVDMTDPGCSSLTDDNEKNIGDIDFTEF